MWCNEQETHNALVPFTKGRFGTKTFKGEVKEQYGTYEVASRVTGAMDNYIDKSLTCVYQGSSLVILWGHMSYLSLIDHSGDPFALSSHWVSNVNSAFDT